MDHINTLDDKLSEIEKRADSSPQKIISDGGLVRQVFREDVPRLLQVIAKLRGQRDEYARWINQDAGFSEPTILAEEDDHELALILSGGGGGGE